MLLMIHFTYVVLCLTLGWSKIEKYGLHQKVLEEELSKVCDHSAEVLQPPVDDQQPPAKKTKFDKLFGFMNTSFEPQKCQTYTEKVQKYLSDTLEVEDAMEYWKVKEKEFPSLSRLVKQMFSVPATSAPIERVFSQGGKSLTPLRSISKPKNLETLIFLKINSQYM